MPSCFHFSAALVKFKSLHLYNIQYTQSLLSQKRMRQTNARQHLVYSKQISLYTHVRVYT